MDGSVRLGLEKVPKVAISQNHSNEARVKHWPFPAGFARSCLVMIICVVYLRYTFCRVGAVQDAWRLKKILPFAVSLCLVTCCDNWHGTRIVVIVATAAMQHWSMNMFFRTYFSLVRAVNSSKWIVLARCHSGVSYSFAAVFSAPENMSTSVIPQAKLLASP